MYVTVNGESNWSKVTTPGISPTFVISGASALTAGDICKGVLPTYGSLQCPSALSLYRVGQSKPSLTFLIPAVGVGKWRAAVVLAAFWPTTAVVKEGGTDVGPSSLLETTNAGRTWRMLKDPCEDLMIQQLLTPTPSHWLLSCFQGAGMMQGANKLWSSSDGGRSWTLKAYSGEQRFYVGNIADTWNTLAMSGNGQLIFSAVGGASGGIETSTDGGHHWKVAKLYPDNGGSPEYLSAFGSTGAIFGVQQGGVWQTLDGVNWTPLLLAAGPYNRHPICTTGRGHYSYSRWGWCSRRNWLRTNRVHGPWISRLLPRRRPRGAARDRTITLARWSRRKQVLEHRPRRIHCVEGARW